MSTQLVHRRDTRRHRMGFREWLAGEMALRRAGREGRRMARRMRARARRGRHAR